MEFTEIGETDELGSRSSSGRAPVTKAYLEREARSMSTADLQESEQVFTQAVEHPSPWDWEHMEQQQLTLAVVKAELARRK